MSTASKCPNPTSEANAWIITHLPELQSRAKANLSLLSREQQEEAVAEVIAMSVAWTRSAARRGRLDKVTAFWLVTFASRQWRQGRRFAGCTSSCVLSKGAKIKHGLKVTSLDSTDEGSVTAPRSQLTESLEDRDTENPFDIVRRRSDYPWIMDREEVSSKAQRVFGYFTETMGAGKQTELAAELKVTPGRVTQLKRQLADALAKHDYHGPLVRRPRGGATHESE